MTCLKNLSGHPQVFLTFLVFAFVCNQAYAKVIDFSFPKCKDSFLGDTTEIPTSLISSQDVGNTTSKQVTVKLTENNLLCDPKKGRLVSLPVSLHDFHDFTQVLTLFSSGYLLHDKIYYSREDFCLQNVSEISNSPFTISVKVCESSCFTGKDACIQKCCEPGKVWDLKNYARGAGKLSCKDPGPKRWEPVLYNNKYDRMDVEEAGKVNLLFKDSHPKHFCEDGGFFVMTLKDYDGMEASPFRVLKDGNVVMKLGRNYWEEVPSDMYCVDGAMNFIPQNITNEVGQTNFTGGFSGNEGDTVLLVCTGFLEDPDTSYTSGGPNLLYVIAMSVASVFLFMTAAVYIILWKRQNLHGWTFLGYILSLLMTFVFLSMAHLFSDGLHNCFIIGIACHFFFLSTFTWLTTINFDIYWTFRSLNPNPGQKPEIIRFLCYSVFAVGVPVIIVSVGIILDEIYGDDPESEVIIPRYGVTRCTMDRSADFPYLFGPVAVLLTCNLLLFVTTLYHIYKSRKVTKLSGMKRSMLKHKIRFFGKLFILAGVTWIFEVISWACTDPQKPVHWIWRFLDIVNILQAIAIFVVFVCNRKTLHELSERFPCVKRIFSVIEKASGVATNSPRRPSNTHVSSIFDVPGLDTIELS